MMFKSNYLQAPMPYCSKFSLLTLQEHGYKTLVMIGDGATDLEVGYPSSLSAVC